MPGHGNLKTTQHYARVLYRKLSDDMGILKTKMQAKDNWLLKVASSFNTGVLKHIVDTYWEKESNL